MQTLCDIDLVDESGLCPLAHALFNGHTDICLELLAANVPTEHGFGSHLNAVNMAAFTGNVVITEALMDVTTAREKAGIADFISTSSFLQSEEEVVKSNSRAMCSAFSQLTAC